MIIFFSIYVFEEWQNGKLICFDEIKSRVSLLSDNQVIDVLKQVGLKNISIYSDYNNRPFDSKLDQVMVFSSTW